MVACLITIQCTYTEYSYYILLSQLRQLKQKNVWIFYAESLNKLSWIDFAVCPPCEVLQKNRAEARLTILDLPWQRVGVEICIHIILLRRSQGLCPLKFWLIFSDHRGDPGGRPCGNVAGCLIVKKYGLSLL